MKWGKTISQSLPVFGADVYKDQPIRICRMVEDFATTTPTCKKKNISVHLNLTIKKNMYTVHDISLCHPFSGKNVNIFTFDSTKKKIFRAVSKTKYQHQSSTPSPNQTSNGLALCI